jgi:hypothetical protein
MGPITTLGLGWAAEVGPDVPDGQLLAQDEVQGSSRDP